MGATCQACGTTQTSPGGYGAQCTECPSGQVAKDDKITCGDEGALPPIYIQCLCMNVHVQAMHASMDRPRRTAAVVSVPRRLLQALRSISRLQRRWWRTVQDQQCITSG